MVPLGPLYHLGNGPTGSRHCVKPVALDDLVGVEGMPLAAWDMQARLVDAAAWQVVLDTARAIERVPQLLGLSPHLIATAGRSPNERSR